MKTKIKKAVSILTAAILSMSSLVFTKASTNKPLFKSECENAELTSDLQVTTNIYGADRPGYSGDGFVWMQGGGTLTFNVTVPETGMYKISMKYMQELSEDGRLQYLYINNKSTGSYMLPYCTQWSDYSFGVQRLEAGANTIQIKSGWGYAYYDTFTVDYGDLDSLDVNPVLTDSKSTAQTQSLMNYLCDVYGNNIISGQQEIYGNGHDGDTEYEFKWLNDLTGKYPAIRGFDYMNFNPLYGWDDGTTERIVDWVNNRNGIATVCWHIHVPNNFANYTLGDTVDWQKATYKPDQTDYNTADAVVEGTKENDYLMLAIDDLATELLELQENGVPIIFRPFHEAEGNGGLNGEGAWFWWGSAGAQVYDKLWELLYTTLTKKYNLHNLIWEYNSYVYDTSDGWYPGNDLVDIVAYDKYNTVYNRLDGLSGCPNEDAISSIFYNLVDLTKGTKLVAMSENDTIPNVDNLTIEKAGWLYFCPWYAEYITSEAYNYQSTLIDIYNSDYVITLDELPSDLKTYSSSEPIIYEPGDVNCDGNISIGDVLLMKQYILGAKTLSTQGGKNSDLNSDKKINSLDLSMMLRKLFSLK